MTDTLYPFGYKAGGPGTPVPWSTIEASRTWQGLHPEIRKRGEAICVASGGTLGIGQAWRDPVADAAEFIKRHHVVPCSTAGSIAWNGSCWALNAGAAPLAPPDRSYHCPSVTLGVTMYAVAIDFVGDLDFFQAHGAAYGFVLMISNEKWHGQPAELPHARSTYNANPALYPLSSWSAWSTPSGPVQNHPDPAEGDMYLGIYVTTIIGPDGKPIILYGNCTRKASALILEWASSQDVVDVLLANPDSIVWDGRDADHPQYTKGNFGAIALLGAMPPGFAKTDFKSWHPSA